MTVSTRTTKRLDALLDQNIQPVLGPFLYLHAGMSTPLIQTPVLVHIHPKDAVALDGPQHHAQTLLVRRPPELLLAHRQVRRRGVQVREIRLAAVLDVAEEHEETGGPVAEFAVGVEFGFEQVVPVQGVVLALSGAADLKRLEAFRRDKADKGIGALGNAGDDIVLELVRDNGVARGATEQFLFVICGKIGRVCPIGADWNRLVSGAL